MTAPTSHSRRVPLPGANLGATTGALVADTHRAVDEYGPEKGYTSLDELDANKGTGSAPGRMDEVFADGAAPTVQEVVAQIPESASVRRLTATLDGSQVGLEYKWVDADGVTNRVRFHDPDPFAPSGSNSARGWTGRWQRGGRYYDPTTAEFAPRNVHKPSSPYHDPQAADDTHIPIEEPDPTLVYSMRPEDL